MLGTEERIDPDPMTPKLDLTFAKIVLSRASYAHCVAHRTQIAGRLPGTPASSVQRIVFESKIPPHRRPLWMRELLANGVWMRLAEH